MPDPRKILDNIAKDIEAEQAIRDIQAGLDNLATEKSAQADELQHKSNLTMYHHDERQSFKEEASTLSREVAALREKSSDMEKNFVTYKDEYREVMDKEEEAKAKAESEKNAPITENVTERDNSQHSHSTSVTITEKGELTAGEQIEDIFQGEGVLDMAFAEMMGAIADRMTSAQRDVTISQSYGQDQQHSTETSHHYQHTRQAEEQEL